MTDDFKHVSGMPVEPQKYNIILTREGQGIDFDFPPASMDMITRFGYILPYDDRCSPNVVEEEEDLYSLLAPVIGQHYEGELAYHTRKQTIISLHETAILGYQRQVIIDPRISNEIATFWEIYLDKRVFPQAEDKKWQQEMCEVIMAELKDKSADKKLAEDIKNQLLEQAAE